MLRTYKTKLVKKSILTEDVCLFNFKLIDPSEINFSAGQYMILNVFQQGKEAVKRLYSIASSETEKNRLEFIVQIVPNGLASTYLSNLKIGDGAVFEGPAGVFGFKQNSNDKVFLATGTGIAPIRTMINSNFKSQAPNPNSNFQNQVSKQENKFYLFWGLKYYKDVYLFDEFRELAENQPNFHFKICLSREENLDEIPEQYRKYFSLGHVDKKMESLCPTVQLKEELSKADFYICGGRDVVESLKQCLLGKKISQEKVFFEKF